jgi:uncharacterized glyoxalase superfamily protein PhnB
VAVIANRSMLPSPVIPELAYRDVGEAVAWLCAAFGFRERLRIGDHRAQLTVPGGGSLVVTDGAPELRVASEHVSHRVMIRVADADDHYRRAIGRGARTLSPPTDYPFGERQYSVEDPGGHRWVFSQSIADVDPASWGGRLLES